MDGKFPTRAAWNQNTVPHVDNVPFGGYLASVLALCVRPDGAEVVTGGADGSARVWDLRTGAPGATMAAHSGPVWAMAVTPDGADVVTGGEDGSARVWVIGTGAPGATMAAHSGPVWAIAVTPDGNELVTGGADGSVRLWDLGSGAARARLTGHSSSVYAAAISPDGADIITGGADGAIRIWDRHTGRPRATLSGHAGTVLAMTVTPDGREIVSGGADVMIRIWDRASGELIGGLRGPPFTRVRAVAVTPEGSEIVTACEDGTAQIWDRQSRTSRATLLGHAGAVTAVAISPDGTEIVTGGADGTIRVWRRADARQVRGADLPGSGLIRMGMGARAVRVFLCHSSADKQAVRELYHRLLADGVQPWLDEEDILPGQDWQMEIRKAVRRADIVLLCLSKGSVTKAGYLQKEIKEVLNVAEELPPGTIFAIPTKLEPCDAPDHLGRWQWVELFADGGYERLLRAIRARAASAVQIRPG